MTTFSTNIDIEDQYKDLLKYIEEQLGRLDGTVSLYEVGRAHQRVFESIHEFEIQRSMWR